MKRFLILLIVLVLSGCARIPDSGPVEEVPHSPEPRSVEIAPEPPAPGVTPERLVDGFILAMADPESNYAVAREYLTEDAEWNPNTGAMVVDGAVEEVDETIALNGIMTGTLDEFGRFTSSDEEVQLDFGLVQENGEWRIGKPPPGLLLSRYVFERFYEHFPVYFISRAGGWVVPDLIHVPESQLTPTRIVQAQLVGPSESLVATVRNALGQVPSDALESATMDASGVVTVDFSEFSQDLPEDRRREVGAQLMWSLAAIPRTSGLQVTVEGSPINLPGQNSSGILEFTSQQSYQVLSRATSPDLFGLQDGAPGRVTSGETFLAFEPRSGTENLRYTQLAMSLDGSQVALVDESRRLVLTGAQQGPWSPEVPSVDRVDAVQFAMGDLWVLGQAAGSSAILRYDGTRNPQRVDLSEIPGSVVGMAISQSGTRAALIIQRGERTTLGMASIQMQSATPRIVAWNELQVLSSGGQPIADPISLDWSTETSLAVLAESRGSRSVFLVSYDGALAEDLGPVSSNPVEVTALPRLGGDAIVVRMQDSSVYRYETRTRWTPMDVRLDSASFPG